MQTMQGMSVKENEKHFRILCEKVKLEWEKGEAVVKC
jgi:hypothetical protein